MIRRPTLITTLVLLAGMGPFGRAALAAAATNAADPPPPARPVSEPARPVAAELAIPTVDTPAPVAPPATAPATPPAADEQPAAPAAEPVAAEEEPVAPAEVDSAAVDATAPGDFAPAADVAYQGAAADFLAATNAARAAVGAAPLVPNAALSAYAARHAATMAGGDHLHHSEISVLLGSWSMVGENVGVGPSVSAIDAALLASPSHYYNLADGAFTHMGIGVHVDGAGRTWTAHVFAM